MRLKKLAKEEPLARPETLSDYEGLYPKLRKVTLCYLIDREKDKVLIAMKKRGFGAGKWNGVGGKLQDGESVEEALIRETKEEIGVNLKSFRKAGIIRFYFYGEGKQELNQEVNVFIADSWSGEPQESEEMQPKWTKISAIPFEEMWSDDRYWLKEALQGRYIDASFLFDEQSNVKEKKIRSIKRRSA